MEHRFQTSFYLSAAVELKLQWCKTLDMTKANIYQQYFLTICCSTITLYCKLKNIYIRFFNRVVSCSRRCTKLNSGLFLTASYRNLQRGWYYALKLFSLVLQCSVARQGSRKCFLHQLGLIMKDELGKIDVQDKYKQFFNRLIILVQLVQ